MTGSDMGSSVLFMLAIVLFIVGGVVFVTGCLAAMVMPIHWGPFILTGVLIGLSGICALLMRVSERRYYANQQAEQPASNQSIPNEKE